MAAKETANERKGAQDKTTGSIIWKRVRFNQLSNFFLLKNVRKYSRVERTRHSNEFANIIKEPIYFWEIA
jgi:hypothetical protein